MGEQGVYGKLTAALPESGYPKCDLTGASIRRLSNNATNNATTPTPPTPAPPTPPANATSNETSNVTTTTAAPTPAPPSGVASDAWSVKIEAASIAGIAAALVAS